MAVDLKMALAFAARVYLSGCFHSQWRATV